MDEDLFGKLDDPTVSFLLKGVLKIPRWQIRKLKDEGISKRDLLHKALKEEELSKMFKGPSFLQKFSSVIGIVGTIWWVVIFLLFLWFPRMTDTMLKKAYQEWSVKGKLFGATQSAQTFFTQGDRDLLAANFIRDREALSRQTGRKSAAIVMRIMSSLYGGAVGVSVFVNHLRGHEILDAFTESSVMLGALTYIMNVLVGAAHTRIEAALQEISGQEKLGNEFLANLDIIYSRVASSVRMWSGIGILTSALIAAFGLPTLVENLSRFTGMEKTSILEVAKRLLSFKREPTEQDMKTFEQIKQKCKTKSWMKCLIASDCEWIPEIETKLDGAGRCHASHAAKIRGKARKKSASLSPQKDASPG